MPKQVNGELAAGLTEQNVPTAKTDQVPPVQKQQQLENVSLESDLNEKSSSLLESVVKLQENIVEADLSAYLSLDETRDELDTLNSTTSSVADSEQAWNDLESIGELFDVDLTKKPRVIQNPILTKYEQMFGGEEIGLVPVSVPEILESFKKILETEQKKWNEECLSEIEEFNNALNRSIDLCRSLTITGTYLDRFNTLIIEMLESKPDSKDIETSNEFIYQVRRLKLALKMANLILAKLDTVAAENLISKGQYYFYFMKPDFSNIIKKI